MNPSDLLSEAEAATSDNTRLALEIATATHGATYGATQAAAGRVLAHVVYNITLTAGDLDFRDAVEDALRERTDR